MPTLHIEHAITDIATWRAAFDKFSQIRAQAGVRAERVQQPDGNDYFVVIDLDFDTTDQAENFLAFLRDKVWSSSAASPALVGATVATILDDEKVTR